MTERYDKPPRRDDAENLLAKAMPKDPFYTLHWRNRDGTHQKHREFPLQDAG